jgi:hypothetical protein
MIGFSKDKIDKLSERLSKENGAKTKINEIF